jgi:extradiol dioxygenase family protein
VEVARGAPATDTRTVTVQFNHTIVHSHDKRASAEFLAEILGLEAPTEYGPFVAVRLGNGVTLDFADEFGTPHTQHYAFLLTEEEFDQVLARLTERGITYWADPFHRLKGQVNTDDGGRGLYWKDPSGHDLEVITVPYGGW